MQILRAMEEQGWILIEPIDEDEEITNDADLSANAQRMTDEEFENYAADILAR